MQHRVHGRERGKAFGAVEVHSVRSRKDADLVARLKGRHGPARDVAAAGDQQAVHRCNCSHMHTVTLQPSGHQFQVEEGEAVLAAGLRQGFVLPYGCKNGACGSCKGKVLSGTVDYGAYQAKALTDEEKAQGKALFCQAAPRSDLVLEARTVGAAKDIQVKKLPCRVQKLERLADDVMVLQLKLPANERLQFLAGQYIEFLLKDGGRRSFSIANPPHDAELIELHVRHVAGGQFTDHVFGKMKERDILRCEGPLGTFFLREDSDKPIVFVASGTGFA